MTIYNFNLIKYLSEKYKTNKDERCAGFFYFETYSKGKMSFTFAAFSACDLSHD